MKWRNFKQTLTQYPWIKKFVGTPVVVDAPLNNSPEEAERTLREWVENKTYYVVVRPWSTLNLESGCTRTVIPMTNPDPALEQAGLAKIWTNDQWTVWFHIANCKDDGPFNRMRYVNQPNNPEGETTIRQVLEHIRKWRGECSFLPHQQVVIDTIVERRTAGNGLVGLSSERIDIFIPPSNFDITKV